MINLHVNEEQGRQYQTVGGFSTLPQGGDVYADYDHVSYLQIYDNADSKKQNPPLGKVTGSMKTRICT